MSGSEFGEPLSPRGILSPGKLARFRADLRFANQFMPARPFQAPPEEQQDRVIDPWFEEEAARLDQQFMQTIQRKVQEDPDLAAEVSRMSIDLGLDREVIKNNIDKARQALSLVRIRDEEIAKTSPILTAWATDPNFAAIAHDDLKELSFVEGWSKQWDAGGLEVERGRLSWQLMDLDSDNPDFEVIQNRLKLVDRYLSHIPHSEKWLTAPGRMFGQMWETSPVTFGAAAVATGLTALATGGVGTPAMVAGMVASGGVGGYQTAVIEGGNAFRDYTLGGMDREVARAHAISVGWQNGIIESIGGIIPAGQFLGAGRNFVRRLAAKGMAKATTTRSIGRAAVGYFAGVTSELVEEGAQEAVNAIHEAMGMDATEELRSQIGQKPGVFTLPGGGTVTTNEDGTVEVSADVYERYTGKRVAEDQTLTADQADRFIADMGRLYPLEKTLSDENYMDDLWGVVWDTMKQTVMAAWLPGIPGPALQFISERKRVEAAKNTVESIKKLSELSADTKLSKRESTALSEFIAATMKGKTLEEIHIDRGDLTEILEKAGVTLDEFEKIMPGTKAQFEEDADVNPSIRWKPGDLATNLEDYEILGEVLDNIRGNDAEAMSMKQARENEKEFKKKEKEYEKELAKDRNKQKMRDTYLDSVEERVESETTQAFEDSKGRKPNREERAQIKVGAGIIRKYVHRRAVEKGVDVSQIPMAEIRAATEQEELRGRGETMLRAAEYVATEGSIDESTARMLLSDSPGVSFIGEEVGEYIPDGVSKFVSKTGSVRYVKSIKGQPVSALQVVSKDGKSATIATAFTVEEHRREGHAAGLLQAARKDFAEVAHNKNLTEEGAAFANAVEGGMLRKAEGGVAELFSALTREIGGLETKSMKASGWKQTLQGLVNKGKIKKDEVFWSGIEHWLDLQEGKITKEAVQEYLELGGVRIEERTLMGDESEHGDYVLPGGENYREVLLSLPTKSLPLDLRGDAFAKAHGYDRGEVTKSGTPASEHWGRAVREAGQEYGQRNFEGGHYSDIIHNVVAHIRMNERTDADGNRVLFIEEIQSDWGQTGRKEGFQPTDPPGPETIASITQRRDAPTFSVWKHKPNGLAYLHSTDHATREEAQTEARAQGLEPRDDYLPSRDGPGLIPTAPFVTSTKGWLNLALKQIVLMATNEGFDRVAFVDGQTSADRYDLSRAVTEIRVARHGNNFGNASQVQPGARDVEVVLKGTGKLQFTVNPDGVVKEVGNEGDLHDKPLSDVVGKEMADKILAADISGRNLLGDEGSFDGPIMLKGEDLKVGGKGMIKFYDEMVPQNAKKMVKKLGGKTTQTDVADLDNAFTIEVTPEMRGAVQETGLSLFAAGEGTTFGQFDTERLEIILFKKHNIATFFHEFAHFHLEILTREYREGKATKQDIADLTTIALWAGYDSLDDYANKLEGATSVEDLDRRRKAHEAFAYSFEQYLYTGEAPTVGLRKVFRRIATWFAQIYGGEDGIKNRLNLAYKDETRSEEHPNGENLPCLTPEVVAVMDRLLASEEEIDNKLRQDAIGRVLQVISQPGFTGVSMATLREGGAIPEEDLERLADLFTDAEGTAKETLRKRLMKDLEYLRRFESRQLQKIQSRSRKVRKAVEQEERESLLIRERVARLQHWLKTGEVLGVDSSSEEGPVLVREESPPNKKQYIVTDDDRVSSKDRRKGDFGAEVDRMSPEMLVEMFGFGSIDEMLNELHAANPLDEEVHALTDTRMKREYSELHTREAMEEAVREAVNSEAMLRFMEAHARAELQKDKELGKGVKGKLELARAAREVARRVVLGLDVKDLESTAKRYAKEADGTQRRAMESKDPEKKQALLRAAIQQRAIAVEAYESKAHIETRKDKLADRLRDRGATRNRSLAKTYGGATVATIREILKMFGIDMGARDRLEPGAMPWDELVIANEGEIHDDPLVEDLQFAYIQMGDIAEGSGNQFENLTVDSAYSVLDGMQGLLTRGRESQMFILDNQKAAVADLVEKLRKINEERGIPEATVEPRDRSALQTTNSRWQRLEPLLRALDGGKSGILTQNIWDPAMEAAVNLDANEKEILKLFDAALEPLRQQMKANPRMGEPIVSDIITDTKTGKKFTFKDGKQDILGMLLHLGNTSNRERLVAGWRWDDDALTRQVKAWEQDGTITEADWQMVGSIWAIYDLMLPQTKKAFYALEGYQMELVERGTVETSWGTIKGGYVPAAADTSAITNTKANQQELDQKGNWSNQLPGVTGGHTIGRTVTASRPLDLSLTRQASHFHAHLLYAHMGPALARIQLFVGNKQVREELERMQPGIMDEHLNDWIETVGTQSTSLSRIKDPTGLDWFARHMRRSAGTAAMFANVKNSLQNISGITLALSRVGPVHLLFALGDYMGNLRGTKKEIYKKSKYMEFRHNKDNNIYEVRERVEDLLLSQNTIIRGGQKLSAWMGRNTYWMQEITQKPLDRIVWLGAYKKEMEDSGSEEKAILAGDAAVRQTQGDTMAISLATGEKGTAVAKMMTQFMSWFIMMGSLRADFSVKQPGKSQMAAAAPIMMTLFTTMVIGELITEALDRLEGEPEDEEERVQRELGMTAIRVTLNSITAPMRAFGPLGAGASAVAANIFNMEQYQQRMPSAPAVAIVERSLREGRQMVRGKDPFTTETVLDFGEAMLILLGVGGVTAGTRRVRRGLGVGVELEPGEEPLDISGGIIGRR